MCKHRLCTENKYRSFSVWIWNCSGDCTDEIKKLNCWFSVHICCLKIGHFNIPWFFNDWSKLTAILLCCSAFWYIENLSAASLMFPMIHNHHHPWAARFSSLRWFFFIWLCASYTDSSYCGFLALSSPYVQARLLPIVWALNSNLSTEQLTFYEKTRRWWRV